MKSPGDSSAASQHPLLPPGFRFHPTDEELVVHYLKKKVASAPLPVAIIAEVDLYKFDPWELPAKATFGEHEWYFFSPRDRKYPNGARPNRAATSGYWKATGTDKPVLSSGGTQKLGVKKALVFYGGKPPKGVKTSWIMHEYRLVDNKADSKPPAFDKQASLRLDDWVLCRIYKKNNPPRHLDQERDESMGDMLVGTIPPSVQAMKATNFSTSSGLLQNDTNDQSLFQGILIGNDFINNNNTGSTSSASGAALYDLTLKRSLVLSPPLYWNNNNINDEDAAGSNSPSKRFLNEANGGKMDDDQNNSILFGHVPQNSTSMHHHQQALLPGSLDDGVLRQSYQISSLNWYS